MASKRDTGSNGPKLGEIMKSLRTERGLTLKEMAERIGIPFSTLAKIEQNRLTLSYDKLQLISHRLNISLSELFAQGALTSPASVMARRSVGHIGQGLNITTQVYIQHFLAHELRQKRMIPIVSELLCTSLDQFGPLYRHAGEEFVYVIEGSAIIHTEFYEPVRLDAGNWTYLDSTMGHAYLRAEDCDVCRLLTTCSSSESDLAPALIHLLSGMEKAEPAETPVTTVRRGRPRKT
jgi:transcriptional regulator with XRE-family HTH domain